MLFFLPAAFFGAALRAAFFAPPFFAAPALLLAGLLAFLAFLVAPPAFFLDAALRAPPLGFAALYRGERDRQTARIAGSPSLTNDPYTKLPEALGAIDPT